ncbi:MAG TPA: RecX family transcriptional regulator [Candidatus Dormibacteraeota bacterium]|jgi:regulatory protein|nr:RecX family transcriptional regulator [Candidatus Dormibacteraeota bacterium]
MQSSKHARVSSLTPRRAASAYPAASAPRADADATPTFASPEEERKAAEQAALRILGGAAQSESALSRRLQRRGFSEEAASAASAAAVRSGYVNDTALARSIVDRRRTRRGTARIAAELRARGLDSDTVTAALDSVSPEEQQESAVREVRRRLRDGLPENPADRRRLLGKTGAALSRLGFRADVIAHALHTVAIEDPEEAA